MNGERVKVRYVRGPATGINRVIGAVEIGCEYEAPAACVMAAAEGEIADFALVDGGAACHVREPGVEPAGPPAPVGAAPMADAMDVSSLRRPRR